MKNYLIRSTILVLGLLAVASSWLSIRPTSENRYRELTERHAIDPKSVSDQEWIMSKDDEGFTALFLLIFGIPLFLFVTIAAPILSKVPKKPFSAWIVTGVAWILLGGALHAMLWLG